jgi:hypothetical protein
VHEAKWPFLYESLYYPPFGLTCDAVVVSIPFYIVWTLSTVFSGEKCSLIIQKGTSVLKCDGAMWQRKACQEIGWYIFLY